MYDVSLVEFFFFFKQKTAYEMRISDWSSDVCSSDLQFRFWVVGSLAGRDAEVAAQVMPFLVAGTLLALASARSLNTLALGEDVARSLGQRVQLARAASALAVVLLCGGATAAAGPIAFIGLTIPHVARAICGPDHRWLPPWCPARSHGR